MKAQDATSKMRIMENTPIDQWLIVSQSEGEHKGTVACSAIAWLVL
jgi:hypothetical protein